MIFFIKICKNQRNGCVKQAELSHFGYFDSVDIHRLWFGGGACK